MRQRKAAAMLFNYPPLALVGRIIAKEKVFRQAKANAKTQAEFADSIKQIRWQYKLAEQTLNIAASEQAKEIQIFSLALNKKQLNTSLLELIDKAIPSPIIFELNYEGQVKLAACLKKQGQIASPYFATDWQAADSPREPLPFALNMAQLYEKLLENIIGASLPPMPEEAGTGAVPPPPEPQESLPPPESLNLAAQIARAEQIRRQKAEVEKLQSRLRREKQYNRKLELNAELSAAMRQLKTLEKR